MTTILMRLFPLLHPPSGAETVSQYSKRRIHRFRVISNAVRNLRSLAYARDDNLVFWRLRHSLARQRGAGVRPGWFQCHDIFLCGTAAVVVALVTIWLFEATAAWAADKLRIGYSGATVSNAMLWVTEEGKLFQKNGIDPEVLYLQTTLGQTAMIVELRVGRDLGRAEPELVRSFGEVFATLAAKQRLPNALLLSAPVELTPWLQGFFARIDFAQFTATTQPLAVETLSPEHLSELVQWDEQATPDTGLGMAASYVHILAAEAHA